MKPVFRFWGHDETCCGRDVFVGVTYRRRRLDLLTGKLGDWDYFDVVHLEPIRHSHVICRRVHIKCRRTGKVYRPQVVNFWSGGYEAVDNVVSLRTEADHGATS